MKKIMTTLSLILMSSTVFASSLNCNIQERHIPSAEDRGLIGGFANHDFSSSFLPLLTPDKKEVKGISNSQLDMGMIGEFKVFANARLSEDILAKESNSTKEPYATIRITAKNPNGSLIETVGIVKTRKTISYSDDAARRVLGVIWEDQGITKLANINCQILDSN